MSRKTVKLFEGIKISHCLVAVLGSIILAFGMYNVHSVANVTEGGILGLILLLEYWFEISPSISGFILNVACYIMGYKVLGRKFIIYSAISTISFSLAYWVCEQFEPVFPEIANMPLVAAVVGALFVGVGCGLCVRIGGATGGDDAFAMAVSKISRMDIQWIYLISDFSVLLLSLSYIPFERIIYSILTVILSGQIIGLIQKIKLPKKHRKNEED